LNKSAGNLDVSKSYIAQTTSQQQQTPIVGGNSNLLPGNMNNVKNLSSTLPAVKEKLTRE
jgi:hypothetical protein